jgi:hypothetical protein
VLAYRLPARPVPGQRPNSHPGTALGGSGCPALYCADDEVCFPPWAPGAHKRCLLGQPVGHVLDGRRFAGEADGGRPRCSSGASAQPNRGAARDKYEYDQSQGIIRLGRRLTGPVSSADYGSAPGTASTVSTWTITDLVAARVR